MNVLLVFLCYVYVLLVIVVSSRMDKILHISRKASRKFLQAMIGNLLQLWTSNLMSFLDVSPEQAYRRIQQERRRREMFESLEELKRVRHKALFLALIDKWTVIDGNKPVKDVEEEIRKSV